MLLSGKTTAQPNELTEDLIDLVRAYFKIEKAQAMTGPDNKRLLAALEANWQAEMEGHHTYTAFAKDEVDPQT
jgi:hypothetical protein